MNSTQPDFVEDVSADDAKLLDFGPYHDPGRKEKSNQSLRPFIAWDGEGCTTDEGYHYYSLFGYSEHPAGHITYRDLHTVDCLDLIATAPAGIHISFSFGYDVNMILKDLPERSLGILKDTTWIRYRGYLIQHIPHKWFSVKKEGMRTVKIFDLFSFFHCSFEDAIKKYDIGTPEERRIIKEGKAGRSEFSFEEMPEIFTYWAVENRFMVELAEKLRDIIERAGFKIRSWHGPTALSAYALKQHHAVSHKSGSNLPEQVLELSRYAYAGGRFEPFKAGYYEGPIYLPDINSAYGYTFSRLPDLSNGVWRYTSNVDRTQVGSVRCGLYHLRFDLGRFSSATPMPLYHRDDRKGISFPSRVEGWYHATEVANLINDSHTEFVEAWIYEDDGTYPFSWVNDMFQTRLEMQKRGDPAEKALKWAIASMYGMTAQRVGWNKRTGEPPRFHELIWAGMLTSECRAMMFNAGIQAARQDALISIDTDGLIATAPFTDLPNGYGENLGQWGCNEYTGILYFQNGIYWLRDQDGTWLPPKSRGIPRKKLSFQAAYDSLCNGRPICADQHSFVGYGLALNGQMDKWRRWITTERQFTFGGSGKRTHSPQLCRLCQSNTRFEDGLHDLISLPPSNPISSPHQLPWLSTEHEDRWREHMKWAIYND